MSDWLKRQFKSFAFFFAPKERISTSDLAALIVDALETADIIEPDDIEEATAIAIEEIDVRKALGDY